MLILRSVRVCERSSACSTTAIAVRPHFEETFEQIKSTFTKLDECNKTLREISENKTSFYKNMATTCSTTSYCDQRSMNVLVCGGREICSKTPLGKINQVDVSSFEVNVFPAAMAEGRHTFKVVRLKGDMYVFGGRDYIKKSVARYSLTTNCWNEVAEMPDHLGSFCACAFVDRIFIFGGSSSVGRITNSCLQFDTNDHKFKN